MRVLHDPKSILELDLSWVHVAGTAWSHRIDSAISRSSAPRRSLVVSTSTVYGAWCPHNWHPLQNALCACAKFKFLGGQLLPVLGLVHSRMHMRLFGACEAEASWLGGKSQVSLWVSLSKIPNACQLRQSVSVLFFFFFFFFFRIYFHHPSFGFCSVLNLPSSPSDQCFHWKYKHKHSLSAAHHQSNMDARIVPIYPAARAQTLPDESSTCWQVTHTATVMSHMEFSQIFTVGRSHQQQSSSSSKFQQISFKKKRFAGTWEELCYLLMCKFTWRQPAGAAGRIRIRCHGAAFATNATAGNSVRPSWGWDSSAFCSSAW